MTLRPMGSLTLGQAVPAALSAQGAIVAAAGVSQPTIAGQLSGIALALSVGMPNPAQALLAAQKIIDGITAAIALGLPTADLQTSGLQAAKAGLEVQLALLQAQVTFAAALGAALGAGGAYAYSYDGTAGTFGSELAAEVSGGLPGGSSDDHVNAIVLVTSIPATWVAMQALFRT